MNRSAHFARAPELPLTRSRDLELSPSLTLSLSARCSKFGAKKSCYLQPADSEIEDQIRTMFGPLDALCSGPTSDRKHRPHYGEGVAEIPVKKTFENVRKMTSLISKRNGGSRQFLEVPTLSLSTEKRENQTRKTSKRSCTGRDEE